MDGDGVVQSEHPLKLKFEGRLHEVEVTAFSQVLLDFAEVAKAANRQSDSNANIDVRIRATGEGSFEAYLSLILANPQACLDVANIGVESVKGIFHTIVGVYRLHKWWAGRKTQPVEPAAGENVTISDVAGDAITVNGNVYNLYVGDASVPLALARSFGALGEQNSITGFQIRDGDEAKLFAADHTEFSEMASIPAAAVPTDNLFVESVDADLRILKVLLERSYTRKWEFFYMGQKISANITDEQFFNDVDSGMPFVKGDSLSVQMDIHKERDEALGVSWTRGYTIRQVKKHVGRSDAMPLF